MVADFPGVGVWVAIGTTPIWDRRVSVSENLRCLSRADRRVSAGGAENCTLRCFLSRPRLEPKLNRMLARGKVESRVTAPSGDTCRPSTINPQSSCGYAIKTFKP